MNNEEKYFLISVENMPEWNDFIKACGNYDTYHTAEYHRLAQQQGEGYPRLFCFSFRGFNAALPFLIRPLSGVLGLEDFIQFDGTSVYGYPGILTSMNPENPNSQEFKTRFQESLKRAMKALSIIAFFSRQNPLINSSWLLSGCAEIVGLSQTVLINLKKPEEEQKKGMTKGHRYDIRKAQSDGVTTFEVDYCEHIGCFYSIYCETMERTQAEDYYRFSIKYFHQLKEYLGDAAKLYVADAQGKIIAASIFLVSNNIIQYHLSGTSSEYLSFSGNKVIIDKVRRWGTENGFSWLHLGGGVGSKVDSLLRFKSGFSKCRRQYEIIKWIINPEIYKYAVERTASPDSCFFPAYRTTMKK